MRKINTFVTALILIVTLTACAGNQTQTIAINTDSGTTAAVIAEAVDGSTDTSSDTTETIDSVSRVQAENSDTHEDPEDYTWDSASVISIILNGETIATSGEGVTVDGSTVTITSAGTYSLSGSLADGQIVVDTEDKETVRIILNGVEISNSTSAPINIVNAKKVVLVLADGTENTISDAATYLFPDAETEDPNAAIFSASDLTIFGNGSLTVKGNYNDGIASKDGLIIASGTIVVNAVDDGIRGMKSQVV